MTIFRASSVANICTNRPSFNQELLQTLESEIIGKKPEYTRESLSNYLEMHGVKTVAQKIEKEIQNKYLFEQDPLPDGAKTHIEKIYLESHGFHPTSYIDDAPAIVRGRKLEDEAISIISEVYSLWDVKKNEQRVMKEGLSGECDIIYNRIIRDCKIPLTWENFRKVDTIISVYYWQLIAYMYLYDCDQAFLDYVLMPTEVTDKMIEFYPERKLAEILETNSSIENLPKNLRVKTFELQVENLEKEFEFLLSRIQKSKEYYDSLTLEKCFRVWK